MEGEYIFSVLAKAREMTETRELEYLAVRKYLGEPLAREIREWVRAHPPNRPLFIDLSGVRAVNASVAEELGPLFMQAVQQMPGLEHKYPVFVIDNADVAYTFARAFDHLNWAALAVLAQAIDPAPMLTILKHDDPGIVVVLGQLSKQMVQILLLADQLWDAGRPLTSEDLTQLEFMRNVGPAARSKRLTELYARRLLSFEENPQNPKERLFTPIWRRQR